MRRMQLQQSILGGSVLHRVGGQRPVRKGICWAFLEGKCAKGKDCKFKHEKPKRDPSKKRQPSREWNESRDKSTDKEKKRMTKEEMARTPCRYDQQGTCRRERQVLFQTWRKGSTDSKDEATEGIPKARKSQRGPKECCHLPEQSVCMFSNWCAWSSLVSRSPVFPRHGERSKPLRPKDYVRHEA